MKKPDVKKILQQEKLTPYQRARLAIYDVIEKETTGNSLLTSAQVEAIFFPVDTTEKEQSDFTIRIKSFEAFNLIVQECDKSVANTLSNLTRLKNYTRDYISIKILETMKHLTISLPESSREIGDKIMLLLDHLSLLNLRGQESIPDDFEPELKKDPVRQLFDGNINEIVQTVKKLKTLMETGEELSKHLGIDILMTPRNWLLKIEDEKESFNNLLKTAQKSLSCVEDDYNNDEIFNLQLIKNPPFLNLDEIQSDPELKPEIEERLKKVLK